MGTLDRTVTATATMGGMSMTSLTATIKPEADIPVAVTGFNTMMTITGNWDTFDHADEPYEDGILTVSYNDGKTYISKGKNGSFSMSYSSGSIADKRIVLDTFSFDLKGWYAFRQNYWGSEGYVLWTWGQPTIQLTSWTGTVPSVIYALFGDMYFVFTRDEDVDGNLTYQDKRVYGNYNPGAKYIGVSTPLKISLTPLQ